MNKSGSTNVSANNSAAGSFLSMMEKTQKSIDDAFADWLDFAVQMETRDGISMVSRRLEFGFTDTLNRLHNQLYGNNTDTSFIPEENDRITRGTRFCARLNLNYRENDLGKYLTEHPECDRASAEYNEHIAENDLNYIQRIIDHAESLKNYSWLLTSYNAWKVRYETLTGKAYVYTPYAEAAESKPKESDKNKSLALNLMKRAG